jgi:hypothetical protein
MPCRKSHLGMASATRVSCGGYRKLIRRDCGYLRAIGSSDCRKVARGRWRGGRPRVSGEVRQLIARMARENFLWGAPRIHGELLMLGFSVSQATVSRYLPARSRRPGQSWRTFVRNQAIAFRQYSKERSRGYAHLHVLSSWAQLKRSGAVQLATLWVGLRRGLGLCSAKLFGWRPMTSHCEVFCIR